MVETLNVQGTQTGRWAGATVKGCITDAITHLRQIQGVDYDNTIAVVRAEDCLAAALSLVEKSNEETITDRSTAATDRVPVQPTTTTANT